MLQRIAAAQWRVLFMVVALSVTIPFILWFAGMFWLAAIHRNPLGADLWTWLDAWVRISRNVTGHFTRT
ncbi:hypothetical protein [Fluviibacter phosphoraccumulans]|uniref:Uncharacterized protein n=1 Tax=Fluviibacter phosphoraccumulans TaxID=1751046 RepID=A0A679HVZ2_9RHOO|nr:hypothetical protein [Fluviibacter phosphoraccumulans]BBU69042.1 hypothetical protein ICHIAU1_13250 [Fluviibacter phosphoraccumulans]BBU71792.1 hypothetical protein ICHIJ1_17110 [Fluviibacter phosphoraccumulans]BCA64977.1 hypothetical protein SHINM1_005790 [Fluviibacter phosphoraccumulans]